MLEGNVGVEAGSQSLALGVHGVEGMLVANCNGVLLIAVFFGLMLQQPILRFMKGLDVRIAVVFFVRIDHHEHFILLGGCGCACGRCDHCGRARTATGSSRVL